MTQERENILSRQIKGLTWGVMITIITVFGGGAVFIVRGYGDARVIMTTVLLEVKNNKETQQEIKNDIRELKNRQDMVESKLISQRLDK